MLRVQRAFPTCVMCGEPGVHATADACLVALRDARDALVKQRDVIGMRTIGSGRGRKWIVAFKRPRASDTSGSTGRGSTPRE